MPNYQYCDALQTDLSAAGVLTVTLNRPERLNAFDGELREAIYNMLADVRDDDNVRVLVLTGAGRAFCSGADLGAQDQRKWPSRPHEPRFMWCVDLLEMPKPTIAAIDGVAAGGGLGLALLCDIRICSDRARLIPIWNKRAIHPDDLVTWTLPKLVGYSRALTWLYLADDIPLDDAQSTGPGDGRVRARRGAAARAQARGQAGGGAHPALCADQARGAARIDPRTERLGDDGGLGPGTRFYQRRSQGGRSRVQGEARTGLQRSLGGL